MREPVARVGAEPVADGLDCCAHGGEVRVAESGGQLVRGGSVFTQGQVAEHFGEEGFAFGDRGAVSAHHDRPEQRQSRPRAVVTAPVGEILI